MSINVYDFFAVILSVHDPTLDAIADRPCALVQSEADAWLIYHNILLSGFCVEKRLYVFAYEYGWRLKDSVRVGELSMLPIKRRKDVGSLVRVAIADATLWLATVAVLGSECGVEQWAFDAGYVSRAICPPIRAVVRTPALSAFTASAGVAGEQPATPHLSGEVPPA